MSSLSWGVLLYFLKIHSIVEDVKTVCQNMFTRIFESNASMMSTDKKYMIPVSRYIASVLCW